jgi:hypothetical protein
MSHSLQTGPRPRRGAAKRQSVSAQGLVVVEAERRTRRAGRRVEGAAGAGAFPNRLSSHAGDCGRRSGIVFGRSADPRRCRRSGCAPAAWRQGRRGDTSRSSRDGAGARTGRRSRNSCPGVAGWPGRRTIESEAGLTLGGGEEHLRLALSGQIAGHMHRLAHAGDGRGHVGVYQFGQDRAQPVLQFRRPGSIASGVTSLSSPGGQATGAPSG